MVVHVPWVGHLRLFSTVMYKVGKPDWNSPEMLERISSFPFPLLYIWEFCHPTKGEKYWNSSNLLPAYNLLKWNFETVKTIMELLKPYDIFTPNSHNSPFWNIVFKGTVLYIQVFNLNEVFLCLFWMERFGKFSYLFAKIAKHGSDSVLFLRNSQYIPVLTQLEMLSSLPWNDFRRFKS